VKEIRYEENVRGRTVVHPLEDRVEGLLDGDGHGMGALEATRDTARNNSRCIALILEALHGKSVLSLSEIATLLDQFDYTHHGPSRYYCED